MKLNKAKNARRNIVFGFVLKIYQILLPFVFRTIIVNVLGVEYLGLNSLFTSVLQVLNLAELGVGTAMVFSMYRPIAEDDTAKICALMQLYKLYYNIIGAVILALGLLLTPFIPNLINGSIPDDMNVYVLYIMNLLATVLSYWMFAYRNSVLQAHQRLDVGSKLTIITDSIKYLLQLLALFLCANYYLYVLAILITQVVNNLLTAVIAKRMYPDYYPSGRLSKEETGIINHRIGDLFTSKLGGVIVNSADTIVISSFLGLEILAVYQNYFYIVNAIMGFIAILNSSVLAGIGNSMIVKSEKENYKEFRLFVFGEAWILAYCSCCFSTMFQTFMTIWMGEKYLLDYPIIILLCIYFIGYEYVMLLSVYKSAGGIWHEDRFRPLISGIANLVMNLVMVHFIGLYGIVLSTILSVYGISAPWITVNVYKSIFKNEDLLKFVRAILKYICVLAFAMLCVNYLCNMIRENTILMLIAKLVITTIVSNVVILLAYIKDPKLKSIYEILRSRILDARKKS